MTMEMTDQQQQALIYALGNLMGESLKNNNASWFGNCIDGLIWQATRLRHEWQGYEAMCVIADMLGHWVKLDSKGGYVRYDLPEYLK